MSRRNSSTSRPSSRATMAPSISIAGLDMVPACRAGPGRALTWIRARAGEGAVWSEPDPDRARRRSGALFRRGGGGGLLGLGGLGGGGHRADVLEHLGVAQHFDLAAALAECGQIRGDALAGHRCATVVFPARAAGPGP